MPFLFFLKKYGSVFSKDIVDFRGSNEKRRRGLKSLGGKE
jgi:hypothetical protein